MPIKSSLIAFLLNKINISYTELACAIGVDRSVVNKWALGSRSFHSGSKHYDFVVEYIVQVNAANSANILEKFFETIYPSQQKNESYIRDCVDRFLALPEIPNSISCQLTKTAEHMHYYNVPVFGTTHGRFTALMDMLSTALSSNQPEEIILFDFEQFEWITNNEHYFKCFKDQLILLLDEGHSISLISDVHYLERYGEFIKLIPFLYPYSNFTEYHFQSDKKLPLSFSYYLVNNQTTIYGNRLSNGDLYTIVLKDQFSLDAAKEHIQSVFKKCVPHLVIQTNSQKLDLIHFISENLQNDEAIYLCSSALSFFTMSRDLLCQVLNQYEADETVQAHLIKLYDCYRSNMERDIPEQQFRHLCHLNYLKKVLDFDSYLLKDLSLLLRKDIVLSREQVVVHIKDTISLLENQQNYRLGLIRYPSQKESIEFEFICKQNRYFIACNQVLKCLKQPKIINEVIDILDDEWDTTPIDYKDNLKVVEILRSLIS